MKKLAINSIFLVAAGLFLSSQQGLAQTTAPKPTETAPTWGIKFYGFVRNDVMYDSRQIVSAREGDLSLYAKDKALDANGKDINKAPTFHMLAITSRLGAVSPAPMLSEPKHQPSSKPNSSETLMETSTNSGFVMPGQN